MRSALLAVGILLAASLGGCVGGSGDPGDGGDTAPPASNQEPSSFFSQTCHHLDCTFDGTRSTDGDGEIVGYTWDFGDGATGQGPVIDHEFPSEGTYEVALDVRDDGGGEDTSRQEVTVHAAPPDHDHGDGDDGDGDPDPNTVPSDYRARYEGPVTPTFEGNWSVPVNDSSASLLQVRFNLSTADLDPGAANVTVNLTDPSGDVLRNESLALRDRGVLWNVTDGLELGSWTVAASGAGLGDEDLGGTEYALVVEVVYDG